MTKMQSLSHGATMTQKYGALGGYMGSAIAPLEGITALIIGQPGEGKSFIVLDCPDCYVFNLDAASTSNPRPRAVVWPVRNEQGRVVGDNNLPINLSWGMVREKVKILLQLAEQNAPRPKVVCFDGLTSMITLLKDWIPRNAGELRLSSTGPKEQWTDLDGKAAWEWLYNEITGTISRLSSAGYGVYVIGHVVNATIAIDEERFVVKPELTITPNFWKRLYPIFELVLAVTRSTRTVTKAREVRTPIPGRAEPLVTIKHDKVDETVYEMAVDARGLEGITKRKIPIPSRIIVPSVNPWDSLQKAYNEAVELARRGETTHPESAAQPVPVQPPEQEPEPEPTPTQNS